MAALGLAIGLPFSRRSGGGLSLGYLADHVADQVDSRIAPANPATDKAIFSAFDHATPTYTRSATCWAADLDLTALSVWNSAGVATKAGVAISPRHVLFCTHDAPAASSTIRFVAADNTLVTRTITALEGIPVTASNYPDITIGLLDSDLPPSIGFVKILPVGWIPYLPLQSGPVLIVDQERKALVSNLYGIGWFEIRTAICEAPGDATRLSFHENPISGDSGSPALFIIQDQLVLIFSATTGVAGGGTFVTGFISELNAIMTSLGGGYDLTEVSLSAFTQVSPPSPTPTLSITTKANESLTLEWDGVFPANVYVDDSLVLINQISGTAITGLTNFIDVEVKIKALLGNLEGSFSNAVTDYPSYGPISCPSAGSSGVINLPAGSWTLSTLFWGVSPNLEGIYIYNGDYTIGYHFVGGIWMNEITATPAGDEVIDFNFELFSDQLGTFTMWNGQGPP